jgi:hypothetical protein
MCVAFFWSSKIMSSIDNLFGNDNFAPHVP